tara:strand:+ start:408 stop:2096 length:1689 start_codon:yes stop_codon:yes gene_type:complete
MESIGIASFYPITKMLQNANEVSLYQEKLMELVPFLKFQNQEQFLFFSILTVAALFVFKNIFLILASYGNIRVITNLYCSWMNRIFRVYLDKPYSYFTENKAGDLAQRKIMQSQKAASSLQIFILLLGSLTNIIGVFMVLCFMNLKAILAISFMMMPIYYVTMKTSREKIYTAGNRIVELEKQGFGITTEILSGIKQVKIFCAEDHFQNQIKKIWNEYSRHSIKNQFLSTLPRPILETMVVLTGVGTLMMFVDIVGQGKEIFPILAVFAVGMYRVLPLAAASSAQFMALAALVPSAETVSNILVEQPLNEKGRGLSPMVDKIEFQNVSFSYSNQEEVLKNVSLNFQNNKYYGVVGVSGSGKSTIIDLIAGFYKPQKGKVLIDGIDLGKVDKRTWLPQLGLISQDSFIYSGTIEDNICFGVNQKDRDQNRIREATRIAFANEFIEMLPQGYQTIVGEKGVKLSGGQRQRLGIARALYLDPPVLIFDEATSSLDANSEKMVQNAIDSLQGKRTVIVVAHRLSTLTNADYIYVIENGEITEKGTHQQLKNGKGLYSNLCKKQTLD